MSKNDSNTLRVDAYFFWKTEKEISVFKDMRIRVVKAHILMVQAPFKSVNYARKGAELIFAYGLALQ